MKQPTMISAELFCIPHGISVVIQKWTELDSYLNHLLGEDFMKLNEYVKLLFDDDNFTRSRKYSWAIGCLDEFDINISDNIKQWDLYYAACIKPLLEAPNIVEMLDAACVVKLKLSVKGNGTQMLEKLKELAKESKTIGKHFRSYVTI
jgi:hypothetical protein